MNTNERLTAVREMLHDCLHEITAIRDKQFDIIHRIRVLYVKSKNIPVNTLSEYWSSTDSLWTAYDECDQQMDEALDKKRKAMEDILQLERVVEMQKYMEGTDRVHNGIFERYRIEEFQYPKRRLLGT